MDRELNEEELQKLYAWIDKIPLTRPKRHISRDFSDGGNSWLSLLALLEIHKDEVTKQAEGVTWPCISSNNHYPLLQSSYMTQMSVYLLVNWLSAELIAVMAAEVVKYFFPKLVDLHNYVPANSTRQKFTNWSLLNRQDTSDFYSFVHVNCVCNIYTDHCIWWRTIVEHCHGSLHLVVRTTPTHTHSSSPSPPIWHTARYSFMDLHCKHICPCGVSHHHAWVVKSLSSCCSW